MSNIRFVILVVFSTFIMGSSIAVVKIGLAYVSPLLLASFRFLFAGIILSMIVLFLKRKHPKSIENWLKVLAIGAFQSTGVSIGIFVGLRTISASEISILTYTSPLFVVIFGSLLFQSRYKFIQWIGVVIGIVGVAITLNAQLELRIGVIYGIFASISWAIATLLIKKWGNDFDTWVLTAYQMLFGGILLLIGSFALEDIIFQSNIHSIFVVFWLVIMASIVQNAVWFYLLKKEDAGKVSSFLFLAPFFGVVSGWIFLNETLYSSIIIGGILIIIGIYLVNRKYEKVKV